MSETKTEKPTAKKRKEAAQKGQSFKSKDLVIACLILMGVQYLINFSDVIEIVTLWHRAIENGFDLGVKDYTYAVLWTGVKVFLPFLLLC